MLQIILLVLGIVALVRLPRLLKARASDYPQIDPEAFRVWRSAEKASAIWLIIASWGVLVVQVGVSLLVGIAMGIARVPQSTMDSAVMWLTIGGIVLLLAMLVPAAIYGSKAKRLKEAAGIPWPKKA